MSQEPKTITGIYNIICREYVTHLLKTCDGMTTSRAYDTIRNPASIGKRDHWTQVARLRLVLTIAECMYPYAAHLLNQPKKSINRAVRDARRRNLQPYTIEQ